MGEDPAGGTTAQWFLLILFSTLIAAVVVLVFVEDSPSRPALASAAPSTTASSTPPGKASMTVLPSPLDQVADQQCLHNRGTDANPDLAPSECASGDFRVVHRTAGTVDGGVCANEPLNTHAFTVEKYVVTYRANVEVDRQLSVPDS